jgi:hypothetical protein
MQYLDFEKFICQDLYIKWENNQNERLRVSILNRRCLCRDFWLKIGRNIPKRIKFSRSSKVEQSADNR